MIERSLTSSKRLVERRPSSALIKGKNCKVREWYFIAHIHLPDCKSLSYRPSHSRPPLILVKLSDPDIKNKENPLTKKRKTGSQLSSIEKEKEKD
jgi:hypothetical protein